ncbi:MAG TPA: tyrosine--tRNA ligase, partial [Ktedonobacteraceae bacterium]|nr:tyrosine--tRNA ligase [Ktedonobacteraceae bacterium]
MSIPTNLLGRFARTTEEVFSLQELQQILASGRQLRIKYGVDLTAPQLHIGHAVNLWMMRALQDLGHKVQFLIGDVTTRIGDPTGRNLLRPLIPKAEIEANAQAFMAQAGMVLRCDDPELYEVRRNSEWYERMSAAELMHLLSMVTHARLASRDMFRERMRHGQDVHMHEMIYPVLQGYDSFALQSDLTIIGSDQLFNELMGRFYQERLGQSPQVIITTKITPGIDGKAKQSKSLGNYIGLTHSPRDKFGRVMTLPDHLIISYLEVYTDVPLEQIAEAAKRVVDEPMKCKLFLAHEIVRRYHGAESADREQEWFLQTFSARRTPVDI